MLGIVRKDAPVFAVFAILNIGGMCAYELWRGVRGLSDLFLVGLFVILAVWGGIAVSENLEAYGLLVTLPLTDREIVTAKFLLAGFTVIACAAALHGAVWAAGLPARSLPLAGLYFVSFAVAGLLVAGVAYVGTYAWGFARVGVLSWLGLPLLSVAAILFYELGLRRGRVSLRGLTLLDDWAVHGVSAVVAAGGITAYYGLMRLATRVKARRD